MAPGRKEIFYIGVDGKLMAVDVKTAPTFEAEAPKELSDSHILSSFGSVTYFRYDAAADGKQFLINSIAPTREGAPSAPITVVLNWFTALKR